MSHFGRKDIHGDAFAFVWVDINNTEIGGYWTVVNNWRSELLTRRDQDKRESSKRFIQQKLHMSGICFAKSSWHWQAGKISHPKLSQLSKTKSIGPASLIKISDFMLDLPFGGEYASLRVQYAVGTSWKGEDWGKKLEVMDHTLHRPHNMRLIMSCIFFWWELFLEITCSKWARLSPHHSIIFGSWELKLCDWNCLDKWQLHVFN